MMLYLVLPWVGGCTTGSSDQGPPTESIAITRWGAGHELFVELDAPVSGVKFEYLAHITRLADNQPATSGTFTLTFVQDGFAIETHADSSVDRPGIFSGASTPPADPGDYELRFQYVDGDHRASWEGGTVTVGSDAAVPVAPEAEGDITFLKESQWQVPFAVAPLEPRAMAPVLEAAGVVHPAPGSTTVVAAPVEGLLAWSELVPAVGRRVTRGEQLGTLIPAGAAEHWSRLQAELATARVDRALAAKALARVEDLAARDLLSERRLEETRARVAQAETELSATRRRLVALTSGGAGAVPIRAPADGVVVALGASHGVAVRPGAPLISVSSGPDVLIEAHVHDRSSPRLEVPPPVLTVRRGDWPAPRDLRASGGQLLTEALVFDPRTLSAPVSVAVTGDVGLVPGDLVELQVGVGAGEPVLAVPRSAIVEVHGRPVVFVQRTGESFTRRPVDVGMADATHVAIHSGLTEGDMVVVRGGFDVHVASLTGALSSHRH